MGHRALSAAGLSLALSLAAAAQGPLKRERWAYAHLERLRARVAAELVSRDLDVQRAVVDAVRADDQGIPFLSWVRALAVLRGVAADDAFTYRAMLCAYPLPEVVDPEGSNAECENLNLSLFLPYSIDDPGEVAFEVTVHDRAGERLWRGELTRDTAVADLRMARPVAVVPGAELPDGSYRVRVRAYIDGLGPRPHDPILEHDFHVLRGYQDRADKAMRAVQARVARLSDADRAALIGLTLGISRPYSGEPFVHRSTAVRDLLRVEKALANLESRRPLLQGIEGRVTLGLPLSEVGQYLLASLELPPAKEPMGLVVFFAGAPSYDGVGHRPGSPESRAPGWLAADLDARDFGRGGAFATVVLESPGRLRDSIQSLGEAIDHLTDWLGVPPRRVVLVAEREAAVVATLGMEKLAPRLSGLVLVAGGGLAKASFAAAGALPILAVPAEGHRGSDGLRRAAELVRGRYGPVQFDGSYELLPATGRTWATALVQTLPRIEAFAGKALAH